MPFETSFITVISLSAPIVLVVLGETINEKSGVINLSIEGTLLITALTACAISVITGSPLIWFYWCWAYWFNCWANYNFV